MEMTEVFSAFELGEALSCVPYGCGHINSTFEVVTKDGGHYVLQKINTGVFRDVDALMENIVGVTAFLRDKCLAGGGNPEREVLRVHTTPVGARISARRTGCVTGCIPLSNIRYLCRW